MAVMMALMWASSTAAMLEISLAEKKGYYKVDLTDFQKVATKVLILVESLGAELVAWRVGVMVEKSVETLD